MTLEFRIPLVPPSVNSCWRRRARGGYYLTKEAEAYIQAVGYLAPKDVPVHKFYGGKYEISLKFSILESSFLRRDLDNLCKIALDSLTKAGILSDDRYVIRISAEKVSVASREQEGTEFTVVGL